ncbi:gluconate 2-dehydrogenase subunit 3 family protein [Novosphingobium sp.]|uniref:gluconate 2-dehydrogenase subunit 3 family protein n=1 Tax=Novosphingobium sp. TaxID=1874826 RepID=UPI003B51F614
MSGWIRRDFLGGATLFAIAAGIPVTAAHAMSPEPGEAPTDRQRRLLREVSDLVIPATHTKGAGELAVGDFVLIALAHGLEGTRQPLSLYATTPGFSPFLRSDKSLRHVDWLESVLDQRAHGDFLKRPATERSAILAALDAQAYPPGPPAADPSPWCRIKTLILIGYYTTETGGSQELRYEPVPGRFDPDVPVTPGTRAFSNDWTAVDFG